MKLDESFIRIRNREGGGGWVVDQGIDEVKTEKSSKITDFR